MEVQGLVDIAAGGAGVVTTIAMISAFLAPETLGTSVLVGIAALAVYGLFRGFGQVGTGMVELGAAITQSDMELKETGESIERFKTLSAVSSYGSLAADRFSGRQSNWERAGYFSDGETVFGGVILAKPADKALEVLELKPSLKLALKAGIFADDLDQGHMLGNRSLSMLSKIERHFNHQTPQSTKNSIKPNGTK